MPFPIVLGVMAAAQGIKAIADKKKRDQAAKNANSGFRNQLIAEALQRKNYDPFESYGHLARGRLFGAIAKAWGLDSIVGKDVINFIGKKENVPGTEGIGGAPFSFDPATYGMPAFGKAKSGGTLLQAIGDTFGAAGTGLSGIYPSGYRAGSVPGGLPSGVDSSSFSQDDFRVGG